MEIIKDGYSDCKAENRYNFECSQCNCEFKFSKDEVEKGIDGCHAACNVIHCPWCGRKIKFDSVNRCIDPKILKEEYVNFLDNWEPEQWKERLNSHQKIIPNYNSQIKKQNKENN